MTSIILAQPQYKKNITGVPLSSLYLAAALDGTNVNVALFDSNVYKDSDRELENLIRDFKPTHFGITSFSPTYSEVIELAKKVKEIDSSIITISGGAHEIGIFNTKPKPNSIDIRVTDTFGENALLQILGQDKVIRDRTKLFPIYDLLESHKNYEFPSILTHEQKSTEISSATGCDGKCDLCSAPKGYIPFPVEQVISNQKRLIDLGYKFVFFNDPNFTNPLSPERMRMSNTKYKYDRTRNLMNAMIEQGFQNEIEWGCQTKVSCINDEILNLMKDAGCTYICYALENIDQNTLKMLGKGITPNQVREAIVKTKERGIKIGLYTMFGTRDDPDKNFEISKKTFDFVESVQPDLLSISAFAYYPKFNRRTGEHQHTELNYENIKYSREPIWNNFDEGYGAYHPFYDTNQLEKVLVELDLRKKLKPEIWGKIERM